MKLYEKIQQGHFAFDRTVKSQTFRFDFEMSEPINEEVLRDAVNKTLKVFPTVASRPVICKDKHSVGMIPNDAEFVISHDFTPVAFGTDETNGYLFRVIVSEPVISFSFFHAVFDGQACICFVIQVMCHYLKGMGHDISDAGISYTEKDLSDPSVTGSPEKLVAEKCNSQEHISTKKYAHDDIFNDKSEEELFEKDVFSLTRYAMPFPSVKKCLKSYGITPLLLFFVLGAQSMRELFDVGDKVIECCFIADLRSRYGSRSQQEFGTPVDIFYTPEMEKMSFSEQLAMAKSELEKLFSGDEMLYKLKSSLDDIDNTMPYIDLTQREMLQPMFTAAARKNSASLFITNIGKLPVPEDMLPFIKNIQVYNIPAKFDPNFCVYTYADTLYLTYIHNSTDEKFINRFIEKLSENGIEAEKVESSIMKLDYLGKLPLEE